MKREDVKDYKQKKTEDLIGHYQDLIDKTLEVADRDLLQEKIDEANEKDGEEKLLNAIKRRRIALDEVGVMLEKVDELDKKLNPTNNEEPEVPGVGIKKFTRQQ